MKIAPTSPPQVSRAQATAVAAAFRAGLVDDAVIKRFKAQSPRH